ncbi:MAG: M18 family aminopeptidase [Gammaproteobacteria bacterium]
MTNEQFNQDLLNFISRSPTPFHATRNMRDELLENGYIELDEGEPWHCSAGGKYLVTRNDSSIIAFSLSDNNPADSGFRMVGAHTDSPCLHIKPSPVITSTNYYQLGVEVYGGALLNPWFDRDLSIAGRVSYRSTAGSLASTLIDFMRPIAVIPSLAIHLDRDANKQRSINAQNHLPPILMQSNDNNPDFEQLLLDEILDQNPSLDIATVLDFELSLYDCAAPRMTGLHEDFISAARLDNLLSCFCGLRSLLNSNSAENALLVCTDHEEVGSASHCGADGPFLESVLKRITDSNEDFCRCMQHSWLISADNAHGIHPNYPEKHDANHGPRLNEGPVIKINANQRYATTSESSALFRHICEQAEIPLQSFVVRSDMACGSTIGPITASKLGVKTLDIGVATFAMHSIRELAGARDSWYLFQSLTLFMQYPV